MLNSWGFSTTIGRELGSFRQLEPSCVSAVARSVAMTAQADPMQAHARVGP
jgi:hypothetical protein